MRINAAVLAVMATTAAAAPLVAVDTAASQVTTATGTTAAPSKTGRPIFPTDVFYEPCVMPNGCRDNSKDDEPKFSLPWFPASSSQVSTATGTTAAPSKTDRPFIDPIRTDRPVIDPIETMRGEPCVMPWGCRDNSKDDEPILPPPRGFPVPPPPGGFPVPPPPGGFPVPPPHEGLPVPVPAPRPLPHPEGLLRPRPIPTREVRTYSVPTETASVSHDTILPVAEPTSA